MNIDDNEKISFILICAQEQNIDRTKAPTDQIYINRVDEIPPRAQAAFGATPRSKLKDWYTSFLKMKYTYFVMYRNGLERTEAYEKFNIQSENKDKWNDIFEIWEYQEIRESIVYILRIHQLERSVVNSEFYNSLDEFNLWIECIEKDTSLPEEFHDMDSHFEISKVEMKTDLKIVSAAITEITHDIVKSNSLSERGVLKAFTKSVSLLFHCEICDYLCVSEDVVKIYATSFEPANNEDFESQLQDSEHYKCGEGITGAIMLGNPTDPFFHVGTNSLVCDGRQSPWHTNAYAKFYQEEALQDFWVFPLYEDSELVAAFRVINKTVNEDEIPYWTYAERLQLIYLARWFQEFFRLCQKYTQESILKSDNCETPPKYIITRTIFSDCFQENAQKWIQQDQFEFLIEHLTQIVHRKIEKKKVGCCIILCHSRDIEHLCTRSTLKDFIIFDNSPENIKNYNDIKTCLHKAAENYSIILPTSGAFIWDENITFKGVKSLGPKPLEIESDDPNYLEKITQNYPNAFAFFLERGQNSILVYYRGRLEYEYYLSDYDGSWNIRSYSSLLDQIKSTLRIATSEGIKTKTIEKVFSAVWWMSYKVIGTMIVITKPDMIKQLKENSEQGREIEKPFDDLKPNMIYDLAMLDGAILMDEEGMVYYGGVHFKYINSLTEKMEIELQHKGTRHHQAGHIVCAENDTLVFTVSENRGIGAFYQKQTIFMDK